MKGKIDLIVGVRAFGVNFKVETKAVLIDTRYHRPFAKNNSSLYISPVKELSFYALQDVCEMHNCIDKLDSKDPFVIKDLEADYYIGVNKNGEEFYGIRVNLGTKEEPFYKAYIINGKSLLNRFKKIKPQYEFTPASFDTNEEEDDSDDTNEQILD